MQEFEFYSPRTLEEVCQALADPGGRLIAGGTDVIPQMRDGHFRARRLIDLTRQPDLRFIEGHNGRVHIGALTTYAQMIASSLLQTEAPALVQASSVVGSVQTRHRGTLGGNIGNASPAGDTLPPLLVLNAEVTLVSTDGERSLALAELLQGPGQSAIGGHEVIHHVSIERPPPNASSIFMRLGNRRGMAVSVASAALVLRMGAEKVVDEARIALGAVAPTVIRCPRAETLLRREQPLTQTLVEEAAQTAAAECSPIDDVRGTAGYRRNAVAQLVGRGLQALAARM
jgi:CO/xanthine dehydrogenase FAD-binding subunit